MGLKDLQGDICAVSIRQVRQNLHKSENCARGREFKGADEESLDEKRMGPDPGLQGHSGCLLGGSSFLT